MNLLIIKLVKPDYKEDVILALQSVGIDKATCIPGYNLDHELANELPMFTGLFKSEQEQRETLIITAKCPDPSQANELIEILRESGLDLENEDFIRAYLFPIQVIYDNSQEEHS